MKRRALLAIVLACLGLVGWILFGRSYRTETVAAGADVEPAPVHADPAPIDVGRAPEEDERAPVEATSAAVAPHDPGPAPAAPVHVDKTARDWVNLLVQDRFGAPVPNAEIAMVAMRTKTNPGSHYGWPTEPSLGRTAADGTARIWYPVWVTPDDEAGELTFQVSHPDFVTKTVDNFKVGVEKRVIVLEHGSFVIVSGWIESPGERIVDVEPHLTWEVNLPEGAWQQIRDGRLSTANIPTGAHAIYLKHSTAEKGVFYSAVTPFTLAEAEQKELHLKLVPGARLEGVLEDEVPRPVQDGNVLLNLQVGDPSGGQAKMLREFRAPILEDGTFTLTNLPPGDGQIIALCDGWASERVVEGEAKNPIAQRIDPATSGTFVLKMEPTASLKAILRAPDGKPVEGATLSCWPNVRWSTGYSSIFLDHSWSATSDARGEVVVANMPWGSMWFGVSHPEFDLELANGDRSRRADLEAGKTTEVALDLVAKEK